MLLPLRNIGLVKKIQLVLIFVLGIIFIILILNIILSPFNIHILIPQALTFFILGPIIILQSINTFREKKIVIPGLDGILDNEEVNLNGHNKSVIFFSLLVLIIGILTICAGILLL